MKRLLLVRHAKSSWDDPEQKDFNRTLNERGKKNAPEMGQRILERNWTVDHVVSSPAKRALKTAKLIAKELNFDVDTIEQDMGIYEAGIDDLRAVLQGQPDTAESIMLVGHNPGISYFLAFLAGEFLMNFPTCGMAYLELPVQSWKEITQGCAKAVELDYPKRDPQDPD